jgi:hypothetical protein
MSKLLSVSSVAALAVALASCSTSTAPAKSAPRTASVVTTAAVPAVPTAPVTLATASTESNVSVTIPVAVLQDIVAAYGGPVSIKLTDVAPKDFASLLPAGTAGTFDAATSASVLLFDITRSAAALAQVTSETILYQGATTSWPFRVVPFGASCTPNTLTASAKSATANADVPLTGVSFTGVIFTGFFTIPRAFLVAKAPFFIRFQCTPVSGSFNP